MKLLGFLSIAVGSPSKNVTMHSITAMMPCAGHLSASTKYRIHTRKQSLEAGSEHVLSTKFHGPRHPVFDQGGAEWDGAPPDQYPPLRLVPSPDRLTRQDLDESSSGYFRTAANMTHLP